MGFKSRRAMAMPTFITFLAYASTASALNAMVYKGCFSSSSPLSDQGSAQFQTSGLCQTTCAGKNNAVLGLSNGSDCWCGDQIPAASSLVDDSKCNTPCNGYGQDKCGGGTSYWSVYTTGLTNDVFQVGGDSSSSTSVQTQTPVAAVTSSAPSVVTSVSPGNTVVVTISASASSSPTSTPSSGPNTAGIAAGVVVGIVGVAAILGGVFFFLRRRRRQQGEEDYKRSAQVSDFMRGGERKAPNTAYSQMSDSRLDPEIGRRNSVGSMADEQDYSRRILRVANPDSH